MKVIKVDEMKKFFKTLLVFFFLISLVTKSAGAQENRVTIYFFWSKTCPHCAKEKAFLQNLVQRNPQVELKSYDVGQGESIRLLQKAGEMLKVDTRWVPFTIVGNQYFSGYTSDETTGAMIKKAVDDALQHGCPDFFATTLSPSPCPPDLSSPKKPLPEVINLPIFGSIKTRDVSLPVLTVILGLLDGFNPCAMWALLFLISLLLGMKDRKRMWLLGTAFIVTSAFVYFLFMSAWLNLFLFLGFIIWVRIAVGLIALGAGTYNLREYYVNREGTCKVTGNTRRREILTKLKEVAQRKEFLLAMVGIIILAFAVNLVELICSAGLPAVYTQVLALSNLPTWRYYSYLLLYILFFMLDDLFVFFATMITLQMAGVDTKYARFSHLIGGIAMLIIGLLMIFKPELLMLG